MSAHPDLYTPWAETPVGRSRFIALPAPAGAWAKYHERNKTMPRGPKRTPLRLNSADKSYLNEDIST